MATEQTFSCPSCSEAFPSFNKLKSHMYHDHGRTVSKAILYGAPRPVAETKWFTCDHCGEKFRGRSNYDAHIRDMLQGAQARREAAERWEQRRRTASEARYSPPQQQVAPSYSSAVGEAAHYAQPMGMAGHAAAALTFVGVLYFLVKRYGDKT